MGQRRVIFMGSTEISKEYLMLLCKNNYKIISVYTQPPRKKDRGQKIKKSPVYEFAEKNNIEINTPINFKEIYDIKKFEKYKPEIVIVMGYGLLLPNEILNIPNYGFINVHVSLLPKWRGAAPIEYAILNGDKKTGVTIFKIEKKLDSGPIIASKEIEIDTNTNRNELSSILKNLGMELLVSTLPKYFAKKITPLKQDNTQSSYAKKITSEFRKIDFNNDVNKVFNHIRAFSPEPSAWFYYRGERLRIIKCSMQKLKSKESMILNEKFHIGCINGKIIPEIIQREGKKPMEIESFLRGYNLKINDKVNE